MKSYETHNKSIQTIMKLYEIPYNMHYIVYKIEYLTLYTPHCIHHIHTNGGNLCKYAYHLLLINATFIRLVYKYNKNIPFFVQFLYVFVPKLAKNCTKLAIFIPKLYKK